MWNITVYLVHFNVDCFSSFSGWLNLKWQRWTVTWGHQKNHVGWFHSYSWIVYAWLPLLLFSHTCLCIRKSCRPKGEISQPLYDVRMIRIKGQSIHLQPQVCRLATANAILDQYAKHVFFLFNKATLYLWTSSIMHSVVTSVYFNRVRVGIFKNWKMFYKATIRKNTTDPENIWSGTWT